MVGSRAFACAPMPRTGESAICRRRPRPGAPTQTFLASPAHGPAARTLRVPGAQQDRQGAAHRNGGKLMKTRGTCRGFATGAGALALVRGATAFAATTASAAPSCAALDSDPANGLAGNPAIKSASSAVIPASGPNVAYCKVNLLYGTNPNQNINIVVGLPLNAGDGGSGGVQGAWNGRTQGLGGGGCAGTLTVTSAVNAGYVGSGNDLGHSGGNCEPGVNADGTYNDQFIEDFIRNGIKQQILWSKRLAKTYYAMAAAYNYWNGCSTGGRPGHLLAPAIRHQAAGNLAHDPAVYRAAVPSGLARGPRLIERPLG